MNKTYEGQIKIIIIKLIYGKFKKKAIEKNS